MKKLAIAALFGIAAAGLVMAPAANSQNNVRHEKLKKAGVLIPISNPQRLPDGKLQFDVYAKDINKLDYIWSKMWGKDFGYYLKDTSKDKNRDCPYFEKRDKTYFHNETIKDMSHYKITLGMQEHLVNEMIAAKCAISPEPDDDAAPDAKDSNNSVDSYFTSMLTAMHFRRD